MREQVLGTVGHRALWGLTDQAVSSLTNFALAILVARSVSTAEFGAFAITLATYYVASGVGQAVASQPLAVKYSAVPREPFKRAAASATGTALFLGLVAGIATVVTSIFVPKIVAAPLLALGLMLPGLLLQDCWRFTFVTEGRPRSAATNDAVWACIQGIGFLTLFLAHRRSAADYVLAWGIGASVSALYGCIQARAVPNIAATRSWIRLNRALALRYTVESLIVRGSTQASLGAIGLIAGLSALGAVRGAQLLFSPLNLIYQGGFLVAVPEAVRALHRAPMRFRHLTYAVSGATAGLAILWTAPILLIPLAAGKGLLGATWVSAQDLLLPVALQNVAISLTMGPQVGLRALAAAGASLRSQAAHAVFVLTATCIGAWLNGASGAVTGIAIGTLIGVAIWWLAFWSRAVRIKSGPTPTGL